MNDKKMNLIDLHVHIFPKRMFEAIWRFFESYDWAVHHENVDRIVKTLKAHGVTTAVGLSYPHKKSVAETLNLFMEEVGKTEPLFKPFASVHPEDENFRRYVDYALSSDNIHGFKFQPLVQAFDVNDPRLDYLYQGCLEKEFPITMHIGSGPYANEFVGPDHFVKLMKKFPELRICVPHMGAPEFDNFLQMMDHHPNMFLDTTMINTPTDLFDTAFRGNQELLVRHQSRVCFGSDWPNVPYGYKDAVLSVEKFGFEPQAYEKVMTKNGLRFLNLD